MKFAGPLAQAVLSPKITVFYLLFVDYLEGVIPPPYLPRRPHLRRKWGANECRHPRVGPDGPILAHLGPSWLHLGSSMFFDRFSIDFELQLGTDLGSTWAQFGIPKRSKMHQKINIVLHRFLDRFLLDF